MISEPVLRLAVALPPSVNHSHQNVLRRSCRTDRLYTAQVPTAHTLAWRAAAFHAAPRAIVAARWQPVCHHCGAILSFYRQTDEPTTPTTNAVAYGPIGSIMSICL